MRDIRLKRFIPVWLGQFISILGSGLSSFGLSVWVYFSTGAATPFAISFLCAMLPTIMFAPFAGSIADRCCRKAIIIFTDSLDALLKIIMAIMLYCDIMPIWVVYIFLFFSSSLSTFQGPAFNASLPLMVGEPNISRANGMLQLSQAAQSLIAPVLAGAIFPFLGLEGLLVIDFITFLFAIATIATAEIPQPSPEQPVNKTDSMLYLIFKDSRDSFNFLFARKDILLYILVFAALNFIANICMILIGPLILGSYDTTTYGLVQTTYGVAMLLGGLLASIMPDIKNKVSAMFGVLILSGIGLVISGWSFNWIMIAFGMFVFFLMVPYANTLFQTILQTSIDSTMLGRIGATVNALLKIVSPLACILAGPLTDNIFEPLMMEQGALGRTFIGTFIGTGPGRGCGIVFILNGIILALICTIMLFKEKGSHR